MNDAELVIKNYRLRARVRVRGEDIAVNTEIRKVRAGKNVAKRGPMYILNFDEFEVEMGEDLTKDIVELLLYMLDEAVVQRMLEEYCERRLKWF